MSRPNLDVFRGFAGQYVKRYGNLRRDGVDEVLNRAVADGASSDDEIWFAQEQLLPIINISEEISFSHRGEKRNRTVLFSWDTQVERVLNVSRMTKKEGKKR